MDGAVKWIKEHPKTVAAVGAGAASAAGAYGLPTEYTSGAFQVLGWLLGLL